MASKLLLGFRDKDSAFGVTRETLQLLSKELDVSETAVIHIAIARLAKDVLPAYEADDGGLSAEELSWVRDHASPQLPRGKLKAKRTLV